MSNPTKILMKPALAALSRGLVLLAVMLVMSACGTKLTDENLAKVKNGMTSAEVKSILGKPTRSDTAKILGLEGTTYYYEADGTEVQISFINDAVSVKLGSFGGKK